MKGNSRLRLFAYEAHDLDAKVGHPQMIMLCVRLEDSEWFAGYSEVA
jgi:hypothetical protein